MFQDMLDAREAGRAPTETFYDGYVVNAIIDACYKSMKSGRWEPVVLGLGPGRERKTGKKARGHAAAARQKMPVITRAPEMKKANQGSKSEKAGVKPARKTRFKALERASRGKSGLGKGEGRGAAGNAAVIVIKTERLPDGRTKTILKDKATGRIVERID
jgi:hypothetical protein